MKKTLSYLGLAVVMLVALAGCNNKEVPDAAIASAMVDGDVAVNMVVGEPAPDFTTTDAAGNTVSLSGFQSVSNVMLVFYRGGWCPFCVSHLDDIQTLFPSLAENNIQLLAISPDDAEASQKIAKKFDQPYVFLSDSDLAISDLYGIRKDDEVPHPAVVLIDKAGNVVWFYAGENYQQRPSAGQLQQVIDQYL